MHDSDRYELVRDIGSGNFGIARLMQDKQTKELVAVKYIERGDKIDEHVKREIINHRSLRHPNIVRFKEVILTPTHLAIVMEYASGGELFERICNAGRFSEDEARFFFQQFICGVSYCHAMQVCHRDLKLENTLLDGSPAPRLKICDFGYSKKPPPPTEQPATIAAPTASLSSLSSAPLLSSLLAAGNLRLSVFAAAPANLPLASPPPCRRRLLLASSDQLEVKRRKE
ncbi:hypothetical protein AAHE18_08G181500 [Arachis hypogaea]